MGTKHFFLGTGESGKAVKIIRIIFGIVCLIVAVFWIIFNIRALKSDGTLWITIIFLSGFGFYQILSGLGRTVRFIEIESDFIKLKKSYILPVIEIMAADIAKIELLPLNVIFFLKSGKRIQIRFGTTYYETNEKIVDEITRFADTNNIPVEIINEEL